ncbi:hypothetical protein [Nocardia sp. NPDC004722]
MRTRDRQPDRMNSLRQRVAVLVLTIIAVSAAGCTSTTDTSSKPMHTAQQFCTPFLSYFRTDFPIDGVSLIYLGAEPDEVMNSQSFGLTCSLYPPATKAPYLSASAGLRPTKSNENEIGVPASLKDEKFVLLSGHAKDIWIRDARLKKGPIQTKGVVELVTRIDPWVSTLEIRNEDDSLAISDAQIAKAADLMIQTTEAMNK